jgi:1-acyl-sn-glycerol-3-phosphate acyltransferase
VTSATLWRRIFTAYCVVSFTVIALTALTINLLLPSLRRRRWIAGGAARLFLRIAGIPIKVRGLELLPRVPCVVVANHASYIDGIVAAAALPPDFAFVIKKEMSRVPLASLLLRRLGSVFVDRFDRHKGGSDTRRVWKLATTGQSLVFFPEGTFDGTRQVGRFLGGAFSTAERTNMPIVAAAIHGTRGVLPPGGILMYRRPITFEVLEVQEPTVDRERSRALIAQALGEPLAP